MLEFTPNDPQSMESYIHDQVPLTLHMGLKVSECHEESVILFAPLKNNSNHLGTAFGGSITAIQALCCWAWLTNFFKSQNINGYIVIQKSESHYERPVKENIKAICKAPSKDVLSAFSKTFQTKGKARLKLHSEIYSNNKRAISFKGDYVGIISK